MAAVNPPILTFQGGIIGAELHNRVDIPAYPQGAEVMENFRPTLQGVMMRRPPSVHIDTFDNSARKGELFPFHFSTEASYLALATVDGFKVYANDGLITIPTVTAAISPAESDAFIDLADGATITASSTGAGSTSSLLDEDGGTSWSSSTAGTEWLRFDMGAAVALKSLWLTATATAPTSMPTAFTVHGSATGAFAGEEATLLTVSAATWWEGLRRKYRFTTPGSYRYYRVRMTANGGGSAYTIAEVSLFKSDWIDVSNTPSSATINGDSIFLDGDGSNYAAIEIPVAIAEPASQHVVAFEITHGPLDIRIGTASGDANLMEYTRLRAGFHRLAFTPNTALVFIQFRHNANAGRILKNTVSILPGPHFTLPCPFGEDDLTEVHTQQIRDVLYMVHTDYWPRRLERRGDRSWSITKLLPDDGPLGDLNTSNISIAASGTSGEITLAASEPLFRGQDVGVLFELSTSGQRRQRTINSPDSWTTGIKVTGIGRPARDINVSVTGTFVGTIRVQSSSGNENSYADDNAALVFSAPASVVHYDARDNQTWFYRVGVKAGEWTSGSATVTISYAGGSSAGIVRVVQFTTSTEVIAEVIEGETIGNTSPTKTWRRGDWNATDGFPAAISDGFGRLWLARGDKVWASKSDNFTSFRSVTSEADSSFSRNLATPSSDAVRWMGKTAHLIIGTSAIEQVGLGNTQSEPIGPSNFQFLPGSEEGGAGIQAIQAGGSILYVHRNRRAIMQFTQNPKALSETSYISVDLTARAPEILNARVVDLAVQREPERRIFAVLESGRLCELLFRREGELDIAAWSVIDTNGRVERVAVLPRQDEDVVYLIVRRKNAAGVWERHIERFGAERVLMDCDRYHLDAALGYTLQKPEITITPSGTTGVIAVVADTGFFQVSDIGRVLWLNGGRGVITACASSTVATVNLTSPLLDDDPCPPYRWGIGTKTNVLTGLLHLEGQPVRIWGDMTDLGTVTVDSGAVTLPQEVSVAYVGLPFRSRWKSLKLAYGAQKGTALGMRKAIKSIILLLHKCGGALTYGKSFSKMRPVPTRTASVPYGEPVPLFSGEKDHAFDAHYESDARVCFEIEGPAPAILAGYVPTLDEKDK